MTDILRKRRGGGRKVYGRKSYLSCCLLLRCSGESLREAMKGRRMGRLERVADRIAEQAGQEVEAIDLQRNRSEEQTDRSADSGIGNIGQYGLRSRLLAAQEQAFYEMPDEAGILQRSPADKNVRETAEEEAASRAEKYKMTPQATEIPGNREAFR